MNQLDTTKQLPTPWYWTEQNLNDQLASELGREHVLYEKKVKTLARREDNDNVLFQVFDYEYQFAIVHLTWSTYKDSEGKWPVTTFYKDWRDFLDNGLLNNEEYE